MVKLYSAGNLGEAHLLLHRLEQAGIEARVLNQHAQGGLGELPFTQAYPEVWLENAADMRRGQAIVAEFEQILRGETGTRVCRGCGEPSPASFEICWNCGKTLVD